MEEEARLCIRNYHEQRALKRAARDDQDDDDDDHDVEIIYAP